MILDGTKNKQMLKVMRPYQVYATQNVIENLKKVDFELGTNKVGYIWHTTGSGKTITSFKTAEFQRVNAENKANGGQTLKVAVTFSQNSSNNDSQLATNQGLFDAIQAYNKEFGTNFGMDNVAGYTQDVTSRLNRTATDKNFLDLVIVVDQLLTGFDAPELNTLYVDRTLKGAGLIQAYSRTNRITDMQEKPWGRINRTTGFKGKTRVWHRVN